jgi:hypothetical protein
MRKQGKQSPIEIGLTQLMGRNPHIWRAISQHYLYIAVGITQSALNGLIPKREAFLGFRKLPKPDYKTKKNKVKSPCVATSWASPSPASEV